MQTIHFQVEDNLYDINIKVQLKKKRESLLMELKNNQDEMKGYDPLETFTEEIVVLSQQEDECNQKLYKIKESKSNV